MEENLTKEAINLALQCKWGEAIKINLRILKDNPEDIDTLNRLSRAYFEIQDIKKSKLTSKKVLSLDPSNNIALKVLDRLKSYQINKSGPKSKTVDASIFIEEAGKTKIVNLINLGSNKTISILSCGDEVCLITHSHKVAITTQDGQYVGKIPDDISARLRDLIKSKNSYKAFVKSANKECLKILIREYKKAKGNEGIISFPKDLSESVSENFSNSDF